MHRRRRARVVLSGFDKGNGVMLGADPRRTKGTVSRDALGCAVEKQARRGVVCYYALGGEHLFDACLRGRDRKHTEAGESEARRLKPMLPEMEVADLLLAHTRFA